jgi:hypothetical protein
LLKATAAAAENYLGLGGGGSKILKFFQSSAAAAGFFSKRSAAAAAYTSTRHLNYLQLFLSIDYSE